MGRYISRVAADRGDPGEQFPFSEHGGGERNADVASVRMPAAPVDGAFALVSTWLIILLSGGGAAALVLLHGFAAIKRDSVQMLDAYAEMLAESREARRRALEQAEKQAEAGGATDAETAVAKEAQASALSAMATQVPSE